MEGRYNLRSPAVKRLMREAQELANPTEQYFAQPLEDNLFEWHFTIRGPNDSDFSGGVYHGRIILPPDYPMKPPSIIFLTPNGRFDCFTKICLSISKHHPESWQPSWSIRTALLAIIGFMPTPGHGAIGSVDYTPAERSKLAKKSVSYVCDHCGRAAEKLLPVTSQSEDSKEEIKNLAAQLSMTGEKSKAANGSTQETDSKDVTTPAAQEAASAEPSGETAAAPITNKVEPSATTITQRTARVADAPPAATQAGSSQTIRRPGQASGPRVDNEGRRHQSRLCFDNVTFWLLVVIGTLLGFLILRRLAKYSYLLGGDEL